MEKFKKFKIQNQQSIVGGETEPTTLTDGSPDRWDKDKKRLIIFC